MAEETFSRKTERQPWEKAFAYQANQIAGGTTVEKYNSIPEYKRANEISQMCFIYANAYAQTMIARLLQEEPDYFEDKPVDKAEFAIHLQNNICLPITKY